MDIQKNISELASYAIEKRLISVEEKYYSINLLLDVLDLNEFEEKEVAEKRPLEDILKDILDYAFSRGLFEENTTVYRDLFDTKVMNCFLPRPDSVSEKFYSLYKKSPKQATDWYYQFAQDSDYIRAYRVKKDLKWKTKTVYGDIDITINLSKPEKDPKAIALLKYQKQTSYPKCQLCKENMGYRGRINHPARETIRIIPITLDGDPFYFQYSPYSYFNEHAIVFNKEHIPMKIDERALRHLLAFTELFPHYILGSNADLPIVGGSILTHDHYQGGSYVFPMFKAKTVEELHFDGYEDVKACYLKWPLSVIRISSNDPKRVLSLAMKILTVWRNYTDEESFIYAYTDSTPHNTITPICHRVGNAFVFDLALRNNITTKEYPLGVYHPHQEYWNIKKENIGLIEVMGVAILPSRLKTELSRLLECYENHLDYHADPLTQKHAGWFDNILKKHSIDDVKDMRSLLQEEVGLTFQNVLECAGVYKQDEKGLEGLNRFVDTVNKQY